MEAIFGIILVVGGYYLFMWVLGAGFKTIGAAGRAVTGKGSFSDNMELAFKGMGPLEVHIEDSHVNEDGTGALVKEIMGKGLFPVEMTKNVAFLTSVFDATSEQYEAVISVLDGFQEPDSVVFQNETNVGKVGPGQGYVSFVRLGVVIPDLLTPPYGGSRNLVVSIRLIDLDNRPSINNGFHGEDTSGILWQKALEFTHFFEEKGYKEASEHRDEAVSLSLKIGMAVALADGVFDESEGRVLQNWIVKSIAPFSDEKKERLKELYNEAMRESYKEAKEGSLVLSYLTERLNEIGEKASKYEAIELCFEVMAADGVADAEEMKLIRGVSESLDLDMAEVEKIRDQKLVDLDVNVTGHASIEMMLGIEPDWSEDKVKKHLRTEFQKWNNRLNTLNEGQERESAQLMLDRIAEARKKYA